MDSFESKTSAFRRLVYSGRVVPPRDLKDHQIPVMISRIEKLRMETNMLRINSSSSSKEEQEKDKGLTVECNC
jgi:hypothetical protein